MKNIIKRLLVIGLTLVVVCPAGYAQRKKKGVEDDRSKVLARVQSMDKQVQVDSGCFVYALPRTVFRLRVAVERDIYTAGPYAAYAEKYLGISKVQTGSKTRYSIKSIAIDAYSESDARQLYMVQPADNSVHFDFLKMTQDGLMLVADNFSLVAGNKPRSYETSVNMPMFTNAGVESMFRDIKSLNSVSADTMELEESEVEMTPIAPTATLQAKTLEERAAEAAQFLLNLRKRKYELLTGDIDAVFNSDDALKVALTELKQMERDCLALFVGKHSKMRATHYYDVVPTAVIDTYPVFKFSEEHGVQNVDGQGRVITLELQPEDKYAAAKISPVARDDSGFKVRLPDVAQVRLLDGKDEMYKGRFLVYQNGKIVNVRFEHFVKAE